MPIHLPTIQMKKLGRVLAQPTTIAGIAALAGDLLSVVLGGVGWRIELPLAAGAAVAIMLPDNSASVGLAVVAVRDALAAAATRDPAAIGHALDELEQTVVALAGTARRKG